MNKILILITIILISGEASAADSGIVGQLANVQGIVKVDDVLAKDGIYLKKGSVITTEEGRASVMLGQETVMHLDRNAILKVDDYAAGKKGESGNLNLQQGNTRTLLKNLGNGVVRKSLFIRTKAAVMGVRGTEVYVSAPIDKPPTFSVVRGEAFIQMMPGPGAPANAPIGGPGKEFILKGGQSVVIPEVKAGVAQGSDSGKTPVVENKDAEKLADQAQEVAPPPQKVETKKQMDRFIASSDPFRFNPNVIPGSGVGFPFDPLLNGGKIPVTVTFGGGTRY
ncbi:MAG: FecR domain-containing protein [Xanthomonadaceae bacterium]|nr:FecR domain-containing protein [Xanthomonadaceae bacterium]